MLFTITSIMFTLKAQLHCRPEISQWPVTERCYQRAIGSYLPAISFWRNADYCPWPCPHFARNRRLVGPRDISARCDSVVKRSRPMLSRLFSRNNINKLPSHSTMSWFDCRGKTGQRLCIRNTCFDHVPPNPFLICLLHISSVHTIISATSVGITIPVWMDLCTLEKNYYFLFHLSHVHKFGQKHDTFEINCTKIKSLTQSLTVHSNNIQYCDLYHIDLRRLSNIFLSFFPNTYLRCWEQNASGEVMHDIVITLTLRSRQYLLETLDSRFQVTVTDASYAFETLCVMHSLHCR